MTSAPDAAGDGGAAVARLAGVGLAYGKVRALDAVSLDVPSGCMVGLIGPDGVGKSSLLSLIAGAHAVREGRVEVLGGDIADARHRRACYARIAYMPQGLGKNLYPTLSWPRMVGFLRQALRPGRPASGSGAGPIPAARPALRPSRTAGGKAFRRHEAEARPVLRAHPRSRPAHPRTSRRQASIRCRGASSGS